MHSKEADSKTRITWKDIHGIGNILRHDYQKIQHHILWQTAQKERPGLRKAMLAIKKVHRLDQAKAGLRNKERQIDCAVATTLVAICRVVSAGY
ncbi:DUF86 domain-containing protein [Hyphomicrobium sp. B1]|uniref:HepT-like ribonuclease domain-containing protein n=1 Tax=Hyphomicrobium sp. B1 TaxID=3075651 RepID=UPI003C2FABE2